MATTRERELVTENEATRACVDAPGAEHDFRLHTYPWGYGDRTRTSLVCVWCKGVACGDPGQPDPCIGIYHHTEDHHTAGGLTWPIGAAHPSIGS